MSVIARLYNFVNGVASDAEQIDAEFNQIISHMNTNLVHKDGTVTMTGPLVLPGDPTLALQAATKQYVDAIATTPALPGVVVMFGGTAVPAGWLECNGQAVSRAVYDTLFAAVGITHGAGDGSTTFNVPDMRGRTPYGVGTMTPGGTVAWAAGTKAGSEFLQAHSHTMTDDSVQAFFLGMAGGSASIGLPFGSVVRTTSSAGAGGSQNLSPGTGMLFIIKT